MSGRADSEDYALTDLVRELQDSLDKARTERTKTRLANDNAPEGWEHVGWIDEHGQLHSVSLRSGVVASDRAVYAPPHSQVRDA